MFRPLLALFLLIANIGAAQPRVTTPKQEFGFDIGADYHLANYTQLTAYWQKLARESDRMKLVEIGKTAEGRPQWMAIVSSAENLKNLDRYRSIARRLALAEDLTEEQARGLAAEGKAIIWIDGGLHATEVLGAQQLVELIYQMVSRTDRETMRFLDDVILLGVPANPDGMELVSNWYMRDKDPVERRLVGVPRLYQKYIGHDNNRDSFMSTQPETTNMARILYKEWIPEIMYNHHQSGPQGAVLFAPPFREPYSYRFDPLMLTGIDAAGAAMHNRFASEGKPGATERNGAPYSNWFNGGLRSTTCYHNIIGLITETIGNPTPMEIPFLAPRQLMTYDNPNPISPQKWHFRQSIEYSITADRAVLDYASRNREHLLYNIYRMGRNSIERGNRDNWTMLPSETAAAKKFEDLRQPSMRDPRAYILPANQRDFLTAIKFVHALQKTGIVVHRASREFTAAGQTYPAGSFVFKTAQAFRPHLMDMFEPQDYPNNFQYPGGPPIPPYDNAGWTLAFQMGIQFDRILEAVDAPLEKAEDPVKVPPGQFELSNTGWTISLSSSNDAYRALALPGAQIAKGGELFLPASSRAAVGQLASEYGLDFRASGAMVNSRPVRAPRIALVDIYGGSMPSGWTRWLLEQFKIPFEVVYPKALDTEDLEAKYDVIYLPSGVYRGRESAQPKPESIPEQ
ncbi:MAG: M14 metallopeptidase family protein, partial [Bryobacteraceae bacterium]